ncbi:MAG: MBL fold metallo-hydrolase [Chloroflexota bacterium]|nr:MBL fold metallo-hydrolase [Chloroflexota bacterium]MDP6756634.1 MBL fold metallo-hydrolase [Chloroflexota bacterium]
MMVPLEDEFGDLVGKSRRGHGLSVEELAAQTGIDAGSLSAFEGYRHDPTREQSDTLAKRLGLDAPKLWEIAADTWAPEAVEPTIAGGLEVQSLWYGPDRVWAYVVGDAASCVLIDAGVPEGDIRAAVGQRELAGVLLTHTHGDHINALGAIVGGTDIPVHMPAEELGAVAGLGGDARPFSDGDVLQAGPGGFKVLHTPGHTAGESCLAVGDAVFVGDALFAGSIGGTNLGVDAFPIHKQTVRDKVLTLPGSTKLFSGHGPQTTVAEELAHNPFF